MRRLANFLFAGLIVLLFLEILIGFPVDLENEEDATHTVDETKASTEAEQHMEGVHLVESRQGQRDWELFAEAAEGYQDKGLWELRKVKIHFYNGDKIDYTVTGKSGSIDNKTKDMKIMGDVVTQSVNGYRFQSPSAFYFAGRRLIQSDGHVKMTGPADAQGQGLILDGDQMETFVAENRMLIKQNVKASKMLNNGKQFRISSQSAEFSGNSKKARFVEQVAIEVDTMKMEGPEAEFQYRPDVDFLQSVLVKGGVKVSDVDKYATSDAVRFDPAENKFVLTGRPRVVQNSDEIMGDQIIFIDGGKKVKVENIKANLESVKPNK